MNDSASDFSWLVAYCRETALLQTALDVLQWDERTGMPAAAGGYRAEQVTLLTGMIHARRTAPRYGEVLQSLSASDLAADSHSDQGATIVRLLEDYQRDVRLPQRLVQALARATVRGQQSWDTARRADNFASFRESLREIVDLKRQAADHLRKEGYSSYEALMDEFEPGARVEPLRQVFADLRGQLVSLVRQIADAACQPDVSLLQRHYSVEAQRAFSRMAAEAIGFDFHRGRLDETSHPFCTSLGPDDCRILTRFDAHWLPGGLYGTLHEAGHGIYDQGLRTDWHGLPPGSYVSLGIHESQSRLWENLVGRSRAFWQYLFPHAVRAFGAALSDVTVDQLHFAVNDVRPSLIRVEADEATYNLHIIIRFELEQELIAGSLAVDDLPGAWNDRYHEYLGIRPPSDADGVLQDVHWSAGLFGYFPTYTLGNLCASQLFDAAERELGDLPAQIAGGDFRPLRQWLQEKVHQHGRCYNPSELIERATGAPLSSDSLIASLRQRYTQLYDLRTP